MSETPLQPGQRVRHAQYGEGAVLVAGTDGFARVLFSGDAGERQVPSASLSAALSRAELVVQNVASGQQRNLRAWLAYQAHALPLIDSAAALTSARIDLLPHQVVLTHRVATASPRRYLIADEVGLGKTIETALVLRELASRGELNRALMVVPAGLVNNWHHELNEVFNLDFEVFGSQGDVTDRKSNAFAKHDRLIASVDTLKMKPRLRRLKDAPTWDLVVFDEAHHLSAYRNGTKVRRTESFKLAEVLRDHCRDLLLLSATPHQGDHFRFYMLVQLLEPTLFTSPADMIDNRHRLNSVIFRRTKADACRPDGSTLFARRWVHTESFVMSDDERDFYNELNVYLMDGFALAKKQGNKGRALGFVMTIFQKIAASSFAAVHRTLRRRLIALTVQEGLMHDNNLDIEARDASYSEARELMRNEYGLPDDQMGRVEAERLVADMKRRLLKDMKDEDLAVLSSEYSQETATTSSEDSVATAVKLALPEERNRIRDLLQKFPKQTETKVQNLMQALGTLWKQNPQERVVIFATYLGSVEMLGEQIDQAYPGQGVVVLKGGDHGTKAAAEKRFKQPEGPRVMICTAAGREGINLQHARILFNFDLPWNPMDLEQRIGRIHRYGQKDTAQVYNLVLSDTIEGRIFLLLDDKLKEIAKTLGKVDEHGEVAEDLRSQILGQLSERLSYEQLYAQAISDPKLKRTKVELEAALSNAQEARTAVHELFQDLDGFSLDDYEPLADTSKGMNDIVAFVKAAAQQEGRDLRMEPNDLVTLSAANGDSEKQFTTDREQSLDSDTLELLGLDHPQVVRYIEEFRELDPVQLGIRVASADGQSGVLSLWHVTTHGDRGETKNLIVPLGIDTEGARVPVWEKQVNQLFRLPPASGSASPLKIATDVFEPMIQRELSHRGVLGKDRGYDSRLVGWVEVI
ncbi:DEAD/DEAH box helicase [Adhaeretor mobilis]|uniref:RNA polymerase-associated protein RapA n=1 Tax=Adhaeretor mobilis TaxID=1930276 RepID=A0A517MS35_9BACT|nr:SNF2-related protein [Adhaeretor mobilis]QDS97684.1 RNA polymerase-associated protein RapA [Adhaeretor mobilis]